MYLHLDAANLPSTISFGLDDSLYLLSESNQSSSGFGSVTSVQETYGSGFEQPEPVSHFSDTTSSAQSNVTNDDDGSNGGHGPNGPGDGSGGPGAGAGAVTAGGVRDDGYQSETLDSGPRNQNSNSSNNQPISSQSGSSHSCSVDVEQRSQEFNTRHRTDPSHDSPGPRTAPLPQGEFSDDDRARVQRMPVSTSDNTNLG